MALDIPRLKAMVIEMWRRGGPDTLVKVAPKGTTPDPSRSAGYCTTIKYLLGRSPAEMELLVGLAVGSKLAGGADIFRLSPLPLAAQFELRGYSQCPAGIPTNAPGYVPHPGYPPGQGVPQWELAGYPQSGMIRIAKLEAGEAFRFPVSSLPSPAT